MQLVCYTKFLQILQASNMYVKKQQVALVNLTNLIKVIYLNTWQITVNYLSMIATDILNQTKIDQIDLR